MIFGKRGPWRNRMLFSQEVGPYVVARFIGLSRPLRAMASMGKQQRYRVHSSFLAYRAEGDIDPTDPEELFLPGLFPVVLLGFGLTISEDLTT